MNGRLKEIIHILRENKITDGITPQKLCKIFEELGPTFIKVGQILSTRIDLLPQDYIQELSKLRSSTLPLSFSEIENILNRCYQDYHSVFKSIDATPIGSASIAQVHIANLLNGEKVVVKIKRPNIDEIMKSDIQLFQQAVSILHLNSFIKVIDFNALLEELYNTTLQELDFKNEVTNLVQFYHNSLSINYISSPKVYVDLCTEETIVMEYIDGIFIHHRDKLLEEGYSLENIALLLSENYIHQALDDGFFHADPHPDNIMVSNDKITYIDLGMMGELSKKNRDLLKECMRAIIEANYLEVTRILIDMCTVTKEIDHMKLQSEIRRILIRYGSASLNEINIMKFSHEAFSLLREFGLILDHDITMLVRGICIIESVLEDLDPNLNLLEVLGNKIKNDSITNVLSISSLKKVGQNIVNSTSGLLRLPGEVSNLITSISNGEIKFKVEFSDSANHVDKIEKLLHELILTILDSVLIVCLCFSEGIQKQILFFFVVCLSIWLLIHIILDHIHNGY